MAFWATVIVNVVFVAPFGGGVTVLGLMTVLIPVMGEDVTESVTGLLKPLSEKTVIVTVLVLPCGIVTWSGVATSSKSGVGFGVIPLMRSMISSTSLSSSSGLGTLAIIDFLTSF